MGVASTPDGRRGWSSIVVAAWVAGWRESRVSNADVGEIEAGVAGVEAVSYCGRRVVAWALRFRRGRRLWRKLLD